MKIPPEAFAFPYRPACVLWVTGNDAATFLQGQFTNDLGSIVGGASVYGLWLDRKGRVIGDSWVTRAPDDSGFWIVSPSCGAEAISGHLGRHIIADEVEVTDETSAWAAIALAGEGTGAWLASEARPGFFFRGRRSAAETFEWILPAGDAAAALAATSAARTASFEDMERLRILSGIPAVPADIGASDLPNEGGLDADAISYSKGCYTGQEVMARIKALGRVRRTLVRVAGTGSRPALPAGLWQGERREGEVRSAVPDGSGFAGLALVSVASAASGSPFALEPAGAASVEICPKS